LLKAEECRWNYLRESEVRAQFGLALKGLEEFRITKL
jgi:hypothetical protein